MNRTQRRNRTPRTPALPASSPEQERARLLCDWQGEKHGTDSHACVTVEASLSYVAVRGAGNFDSATWTARLAGTAHGDDTPYSVHLDIEAVFLGAGSGKMDIALPDVRYLPTLVSALSVLVDRARSIGMIPPDEPETETR